MYTLFTDRSTANVRVSVPPSYDYVRRQLRKNLIKVLRHHRGASYAVRSNHILVKLLTNLSVDPTLPLFEYHRLVSNRVEGVARANGLTTPSKRGSVTDDDRFYGKNVYEALLLVTEDVDLLNLDQEWTSLQPVQVLRHPFTSLTFEALDGSQSTESQSYAVIQIDLVKLALQYRQWYLIQKRADEPFIRSPMQFVHEFPLGNGLISQLEVAMFNRLMALAQGQPVDAFYSSWPFHLTDVDAKVDKYLLDRLAHMRRRPMTYEEMLRQVPLIDDHRDLYVCSRAPETAVTRQNGWAVTLALLPMLEFMVQIDYDAGSSRNYADANDIKREYRELKQDRDFSSALGNDEAKEILDRIDRAILAYL